MLKLLWYSSVPFVFIFEWAYWEVDTCSGHAFHIPNISNG
jgi:hypothetical protein